MFEDNLDTNTEKITYSLVIPCYNESDNLEELVVHCRSLLRVRQDIEVILVDNGSTDCTPDVLKNLLINTPTSRMRSIRVKANKGYGYGILMGLYECVGDVLGWTHADLQTDPVDFANAISHIEQTKDLDQLFLKGKRLGRPFKDVFFTWGMSLIEWMILGVRMWDINAQPTVFSKEFFLSWKNPPNDFSIDLFVYHEAIRRNFIIKRFPVNFGLRLRGQGHNEKLISKIKYSWKTVLFSLGLRRHIKGY